MLSRSSNLVTMLANHTIFVCFCVHGNQPSDVLDPHVMVFRLPNSRSQEEQLGIEHQAIDAPREAAPEWTGMELPRELTDKAVTCVGAPVLGSC